jgi:hypothetical protein
MLLDFRSSNNATNTRHVVNGDVMDGVSTSRFEITPSGMAGFAGTISLGNNGGFASVGLAPIPVDLSRYQAFVLRVSGDRRRCRFTVRTEAEWNAPIYRCLFPTQRGQWQEHGLAFKDFVPAFRGRLLSDASPLDPRRVCSLSFFISDKQAGRFRLEIQFIGLGSIKTPQPPE